MADKKIKQEEKVESKGSQPEKKVETKKEETPVENKQESKPAVAKAQQTQPLDAESKKESKKVEKEAKVELEREYVIPLRRAFLNSPRFGRAKKAVKTIKIFLAKHMKVEDRDTRKVKVDIYLNNEIWFKGIKNPPKSVKVKAVKRDGIVYVELAEVPEHVKFLMAKDKKRHAAKVETPKHASKAKDTKEEIKDADEKDKSTQEAGIKANKAANKSAKHSTQGAHADKTQPIRKVLK